jgi:hypothetical protein
MKDTLITVKRKKIELITLLVCFVVANALNLFAIILYKTSLLELWTCLGYIVAATVGLYVLWIIIRIIFHAIRKIFKRSKHS